MYAVVAKLLQATSQVFVKGVSAMAILDPDIHLPIEKQSYVLVAAAGQRLMLLSVPRDPAQAPPASTTSSRTESTPVYLQLEEMQSKGDEGQLRGFTSLAMFHRKRCLNLLGVARQQPVRLSLDSMQ